MHVGIGWDHGPHCASGQRITASSDGHGGPVRRAAEELASCLLPIRELVIRIPAPGGDHGQNEDSALPQQVLISGGIALAHILGDMGEVELDRSAATRLEVDEQHSGLRAQHVAGMRFAVQQLLASATVDDRLSAASQRSNEKLPIRVGKIRSEAAALHKMLSLFDSIGEVRRPDIELAHASMQSLERIRIVGWWDRASHRGFVVGPQRDGEAITLIDARLRSWLQTSYRASEFGEPLG